MDVTRYWNEDKMYPRYRVLITGAAGFIGSHLAGRLLRAGHAVVGVDNFLTGRRENFGAVVELDITQRHDLYAFANEWLPDVVIHCAASYSDPNKWHRDTDTNIAGTINAINVAKHHGARLIYFQTALPPISSYAISKIAGGEYIRLSGVPQVTFRLSNIYGPRNLSGPIPTFYKRLTAGQECMIADTRRDMVYIDDLVRAVVTALDRHGIAGTIDICSGTHRPIRELFDAVLETAGADIADVVAVRHVSRPDDDVEQMQLDPSRAFDVLDWAPIVALGEGVREAVAWYRDHGVTETHTHLSLKG